MFGKSILYILICLPTLMLYVQGQNKTVAVKNAKINWVGHKIVGDHNGTVLLKNGALVVNNDEIKGGTFIVDMNSISVKDLEGQGKTRLEQHLKDGDFFNTSKYPEAVLKFKRITKKSPEQYLINADLTIKGVSKPISFNLYTQNRKANARLEIDRTLYGIEYGSKSFFDNLGDYAISDDFDIDISFNY